MVLFRGSLPPPPPPPRRSLKKVKFCEVNELSHMPKNKCKLLSDVSSWLKAYLPTLIQGRTFGGVGVCGGCDTSPAFQNRSKVGPEKCISDNQFGP